MTQLEAAVNNTLTEEMREAARLEGVDIGKVIDAIRAGKAVLPRNKKHFVKAPRVIGEGFLTKVNANVGTSYGYSSMEEELKKARIAVEAGADAVMVLSTWGKTREIRQRMVEMLPVPVGSVPIYDAAVRALETGRKVVEFSEADFLELFRQHAEDGVDFMTIHVGVTNRSLRYLRDSKRILKMVSRGGAIIAGWMIVNNAENPFYKYFDEVLDMAREYDVTLSLGDAMRPGAVMDATDPQQLEELFILGELVERARKRGVQVMVEGPGHVPLDQIEMNVKLMKRITSGTPIFLLGPLPTDRALGYDHVAAAIGGALAAYHGADFLCYVTPSEHLSLPTIEDVKEGVIVTKIAAIVADVAKGHPLAIKLEKKMAQARKRFDWDEMFSLAVHSERARYKIEKRPYVDKGCSMCGPFCALKIVEDYLCAEEFRPV